MKRILSKECLVVLSVLLFGWGCQKSNLESPITGKESISELDAKIDPDDRKALKDFEQVNLVGDNSEYNPAHIDTNLVNAWGIAFPASGPAWVTSFGKGVSAIYNADGTSARPVVTIPSHATASGGHPTGIVANATTDFKLPNGNPARFIFAEADGLISGWNGGNAAIKMADDSSGEVYLGLAMAADGGNNFLYAANFSQGKIDVFDKNMIKVNKTFVDPYLPHGYVPLNIQNIDGKLYVMYGQPGTGADVISPRNGFVDIYNPDGRFIKRFISQGQLNAPWGITKAPAGFFGDRSRTGDIFLVGNFGDGHINAYNAEGEFQGQLRAHGKPIKIERLWGIAFAPATSTVVDHNLLFFAAGPDGEKHGLFGYIKK
ncbi:TIGR03118 family protein [Ferruginibacter profundus]